MWEATEIWGFICYCSITNWFLLTHHPAKIPTSAFSLHLEKNLKSFPWSTLHAMPLHTSWHSSSASCSHIPCTVAMPASEGCQAHSHCRAVPLAILSAWHILLPALTPSWPSSYLKCLRGNFPNHLSWKDSICHSVSLSLIFILAFITTRYFPFLFICLFLILPVLFTTESPMPSKEPVA